MCETISVKPLLIWLLKVDLRKWLSCFEKTAAYRERHWKKRINEAECLDWFLAE